METKTLIAIVIISLIFSELKPQKIEIPATASENLTGYLYAEDQVIGGVHYVLSCKETKINSVPGYQFDLEAGGKKESFKMFDIKPGDKSISLFKEQLVIAVNKLKKNIQPKTGDQKSAENTKEEVDKFATDYLTNAYSSAILKSDSGTIIGILYANKIINFYKTGKDKNYNNIEIEEGKITIQRVDIKFEYEQIAGIKVIGYNTTGDTLVFQNRLPISYSTKADVSRDHIAKRIKDSNLDATSGEFYLHFDEVFSNDYKLVNQTEDYSPIDQVISIEPEKPGRVIKKETVTNLLNAAIYTDLIAFNGSQPNGLIQTEISRRFYINRAVHRSGKDKYSYYGWTNSIKPMVVFSKLESNNKFLELMIPPPVDSLPKYIKTIDVLRHTSWSTGGDFNIIYFGCPRLQSMIYFNIGMDIRNVPMKLPGSDTTKTFNDIKVDENGEFNKTFIDLYPELHWNISPHNKFLFDYNIKYYWLFNFSKDFKMVSNTENFFNRETMKNNAGILSFRFMAALKLSDKTNGVIFFRSFYNFVLKDCSQNYFQMQLGYSFNIFDRNIEPPPLKPFGGL